MTECGTTTCLAIAAHYFELQRNTSDCRDNLIGVLDRIRLVLMSPMHSIMFHQVTTPTLPRRHNGVISQNIASNYHTIYRRRTRYQAPLHRDFIGDFAHAELAKLSASVLLLSLPLNSAGAPGKQPVLIPD
jgi:hypothetical protein